MKLARQPLHLTVVGGPFVPPSCPDGEHDRDAIVGELRENWPDTVDLAKQRGLLCRVHAMLNA